MPNYEFEASEDRERTDRDGEPIFGDTLKITLHLDDAWKLAEAILGKIRELDSDEAWVNIELNGAME